MDSGYCQHNIGESNVIYGKQTIIDLPLSTAASRLDCSDVDLFHLHHRIERALGEIGIGIGDRFRQGDRRNLPGQFPFVRASAARALRVTPPENPTRSVALFVRLKALVPRALLVPTCTVPALMFVGPE